MATSEQTLLDLVNLENSPAKLLSLVNVQLALPELTGDGVRDTSVVISGVPGRGYRGSVTVTYARIPLDLVAPSASLRSTQQFTPTMVVSMLNSMYKLALTVDDLEPFEVPPLELGVPQNLSVVAKEGSKGFTGQIDVEFLFGRTLLESVVGVRILPVQKHPIALAGRQCARMLTWDVDFTSVRDAIKLNNLNTYTDWATVLTVCAYFNIPGWAQGYVTDMPTSSVPDSNPEFDRVVIQRNVSSPEMAGDVYLHYNTFDEA